MHARFTKFLTDFNTVGKRLGSATGAYNSAVASMEGRLLPQLRRVEELGVAPGKEIDPPEPAEITVRAITAPELHEAESAALD
jgi:DNA recombination protein RmuC